MQCKWQLGQKTPFRWHAVYSELQSPRHARVVAIAIKQTENISWNNAGENPSGFEKKENASEKKNHNWRYKNYQNFSTVTHVSTDTSQVVCWLLCLRPTSETDYPECTARQNSLISVCSLKFMATTQYELKIIDDFVTLDLLEGPGRVLTVPTEITLVKVKGKSVKRSSRISKM